MKKKELKKMMFKEITKKEDKIMFIEKLNFEDIKMFFKNHYSRGIVRYVVKVDKMNINKNNELVVKLELIDPDNYYSCGFDIFKLKDFELIVNPIITQLDYLSFMYEKFGEEYLTALKAHLENYKQEKISEIDSKNKKIIDELTK